jgi:hypothetical protein
MACGATAAGRAGAGAGPGCGPPKAVWCGTALADFPVPGRSKLLTVSCCWGGWLVLVRGVGACLDVGGRLQLGPPSSMSASTSGLSSPVLPHRLWRVVSWVGFLLGRDWWGGDHVVGGVLPRINIGTDV